jgi:hypothetical protein
MFRILLNPEHFYYKSFVLSVDIFNLLYVFWRVARCCLVLAYFPYFETRSSGKNESHCFL